MTVTSSTKRVRLSTGVTLEYVEQGDPSGTPVIMLHGVTDSWRSYEPVLPHLPSSVHAFTVTQRGHGDSDKPDDGYRMQEFAADIAAFMDVSGIDRAVIVGSSMGSSVAQRFAIDFPERVTALVLSAAFFNYLENPDVVSFANEGIMPLTDPIDPAFAREFQESTLNQPVPDAFLDMVVDESMKVPARVWRGVFGGLLESADSGDVHRISAPTLLIWGDQDVFAPRVDQESLVTTIPDAGLIIYEGHGHAVHWEDPERFATDIVRFIDTASN
jgi:non-heme chloroperoxidase